MINYRPLTTSSYLSERYSLLENVEGIEFLPYYDSAGIPTIGVGFNLTVGDNFENVAAQVAPALSSSQIQELKSIALFNYNLSNSALRAALNYKMNEFHNENSSIPVTFAYSNNSQVKSSFDAIVLDDAKEEGLNSQFLSDPPESEERVALFSLYYNSPGLIGSGIENAINNGNREDVWYEIRYNSNGGDLNGIAKRRYYEAEKFGLYNNPSDVSAEDAEKILQMYTSNRSEVLEYEHQYSSQITQAESDYNVNISSLSEALHSAKQELADIYNLTVNVDNYEFVVAEESGNSLSGGDNHLYNPKDDDALIGLNGNDTLYGEGGEDILLGSSGNDQLFGNEDNDSLSGGVGNDTLAGGEGADTLDGGDGNDALLGGAGADSIDGSNGNDTILAGDTADTLNGGGGTDALSYQFATSGLNLTLGNITNVTDMEGVIATDFDDTVIGGGENNIFNGKGGNDSLSGAAGADTILGGNGDDTLKGGTEADLLEGGAGVDILYSNSTATDSTNGDTLYGGDGNDTLYGGDGSQLYGGAGVDHLHAAELTGDYTLKGGNGDDVYHIARGDAATNINAVSYIYIQIVDSDGKFKIIFDGTSFSSFETGTISGRTSFGFEAGDGDIFPDAYLYYNDYQDSYYLGNNLELDAIRIENVANITSSQISIADGNIVFNLTPDDNTAGAENGSGFTYDVDLDIEEEPGSSGTEVTGTSGNDALAPSGNDSTITGGAGADRFIFNPAQGNTIATIADFSAAAGDTIDITAYDSTVTTLSSLSVTSTVDGNARFVLAQPGENLTVVLEGIAPEAVTQEYFLSNTLDYGTGSSLTGTASAESIWGGTGNDTIQGNNGDDYGAGETGNDSILGGAGNDSFWGGYGADSLSGETGDDQLVGDGGNDIIYGGDGTDALFGEAGNDTLNGGAGADYLEGGTGNDIFRYVALGDSTASLTDTVGDFTKGQDRIDVTGLGFTGVASGSGSGTVLGYSSSGGITTLSNAAGSFVINFTGTIAFDNSDFIFAAASGATSGNDSLTGTAGNDSIDGLAGNDTISGLDGNDTLIGGLGADSLVGGNGVDMAGYAAASTGVTINLANGTQSGSGEENGDVLSGIEGVIGSAFADTLAGNGSANSLSGGAGDDNLTGNNGNDTLDGGAGADTLNGGSGTDTLSYAASASAVTVDLVAGTGTGGDAQGDVISNMEVLIGSDYADSLTGVNDVLIGGGGNDTLTGSTSQDTFIGGTGADSIIGDDGTDTLDYSASSAGVTVNLSTGTGSGGDAQGDSLSSIENIVGSAFADSLIGNGFSNYFSAGAGNDTITGNNGNDTFNGGAGADTFDGNSGSDIVTYASSGAAVTVNLVTGTGSGGDAEGDTLSTSSLEGLIGSAYNDHLTGNNDSLYGGAGNDTLIGGSSKDTMEGGAGADSIDGGSGTDTASYTASSAGVTINLTTGSHSGGDAAGDILVSIEALIGSDYADSLTGNNSGNTIDAGGGNDTLQGATNADTLTGGSGADVFLYAAANESSASQSDRITDFTCGEDLIDLSAISAISGFGDLTVTLNGGDTEITYSTTFRLLLTGDYTQGSNVLDASDFVF